MTPCRAAGPPSRAYLALLPLAVGFILIARSARRFPGSDFHVYYRAGKQFLAGAHLYGLHDVTWPLQRFRYAPGTALVFAPFAWLSYPAARAAWASASVALALAVTVALQRRLGARAWFAVPLAWLCLVHPFAQELQLGQVHLLVLALATASFALQDRGRDRSAGLLLALAVALKVSPLLLVLEAVLRRRWRVLGGFGAGLAVLVAAAVLRYGPAGALAEHAAWLESQRHLTADLLDYPINQSLFAIARAGGGGTAAGLLAGVAFATLALTARPSELRRALCLCAMVLVTPNGWVQGFVVAAPLVALLLARRDGLALAALGLAGASTLLGYDVLGAAGEEWALTHRLVGLALATLFLLARFGGAAGGAIAVRPRPGASEAASK